MKQDCSVLNDRGGWKNGETGRSGKSIVRNDARKINVKAQKKGKGNLLIKFPLRFGVFVFNCSKLPPTATATVTYNCYCHCHCLQSPFLPLSVSPFLRVTIPWLSE